MVKYVCIGCGFEQKMKDVKSEICPYCGDCLYEVDETGEIEFIDDECEQ
jgi:hypothetical protein